MSSARVRFHLAFRVWWLGVQLQRCAWKLSPDLDNEMNRLVRMHDHLGRMPTPEEMGQEAQA